MAGNFLLKIFLAGEGGVGKSTLVERFMKGIFNEKMKITIGVQHSVTSIDTTKGKVQLQIWDLGGEERFKSIIPIYIRGSHAGIICFDTTRYSTYKNLFHNWMDLIRGNLPDIPLILVGTKTDIIDTLPDEEMFEELKEKYNVKEIIFTSSKTGDNVEKVFIQLAEAVLKDTEDI